MTENTNAAIAALSRVAAIWQARLNDAWTPPPGSPFPWAQVRLSLSALLPGMRDAGEWVRRAASLSPPGGGKLKMGQQDIGARTVTVILAGNTPLLAWSPLCVCLLAGADTVRVKLSRDESIWTRLFVETLAEVAPEVAARVELLDFPGADERTYALLTNADAVIAYGSDATVAALQSRTPPGVPFFGYGHAVSVGILVEGVTAAADGFARDVLMYDQAGCLSPHLICCARLPESDARYTHVLSRYFGTHSLGLALQEQAFSLTVAMRRNVGDAVAIREARDMATMEGAISIGDDALRWTTITTGAVEYPEPVGHSVVYVSPVESPEQLRELLKPVWGIVSCAGVAGELPPEWEAVLRDAGVSRICKPGEMQTPPLDWRNGNRDLLAELLRVRIER